MNDNTFKHKSKKSDIVSSSVMSVLFFAASVGIWFLSPDKVADQVAKYLGCFIFPIVGIMAVYAVIESVIAQNTVYIIDKTGLVVKKYEKEQCYPWASFTDFEFSLGNLRLYDAGGRKLAFCDLERFDEFLKQVADYYTPLADHGIFKLRISPEKERERVMKARTRGTIMNLIGPVILLAFYGLTGYWVYRVYFRFILHPVGVEKNIYLFGIPNVIMIYALHAALGLMVCMLLYYFFTGRRSRSRFKVINQDGKYYIKFAETAKRCWPYFSLISTAFHARHSGCPVAFLRTDDVYPPALQEGITELGLQSELIDGNALILDAANAEAFFASLPLNVGWKGKYLLLPREVDEYAVQWFTDNVKVKRKKVTFPPDACFFCNEKTVGPFDEYEIDDALDQILAVEMELFYQLPPPSQLTRSPMRELLNIGAYPHDFLFTMTMKNDLFEIYFRDCCESHLTVTGYSDGRIECLKQQSRPFFMLKYPRLPFIFLYCISPFCAPVMLLFVPVLVLFRNRTMRTKV